MEVSRLCKTVVNLPHDLLLLSFFLALYFCCNVTAPPTGLAYERINTVLETMLGLNGEKINCFRHSVDKAGLDFVGAF